MQWELRGGRSGRCADGLICATSREFRRFLDGGQGGTTDFVVFRKSCCIAAWLPSMKIELVKRTREQ
jgi:hypothetical protein